MDKPSVQIQKTQNKFQNLKDKNCIITGAGSGLGRQLAINLHTLGVNLVLVGRNKQNLEETKKISLQIKTKNSAPIHIISADVSIWKQAKVLVGEAVNILGNIDIVLANAGQSMHASIQTCQENVFQKMMEANYYTAVNTIQNVLPYVEKQKGIVAAISSIQAVIGVPYHSAYAAAKHALNGYLETLELESSVSVVEIMPGWISGTSLRSTAIDGQGNILETRSSHKRHSRSSVSVEECALAVVEALACRRRYTYRPKLWKHIPLAKLFFRSALNKKIISLQSYGTK